MIMKFPTSLTPTITLHTIWDIVQSVVLFDVDVAQKSGKPHDHRPHSDLDTDPEIAACRYQDKHTSASHHGQWLKWQT